MQKISFKLTRKQLSALQHPHAPPEPTTYIRQPFVGKSSYKIGKILSRAGFRAAFYPVTTLRGILSHTKDPQPSTERSGVYRLSCADCNAVYVGQTGRALKLRVDEHKAFWRRRKKRTHDDFHGSAFADHLVAAGHSCCHVKGVRLLHNATKGRRLSHLEYAEIVSHIMSGRFRVVNDATSTPEIISYLCTP